MDSGYVVTIAKFHCARAEQERRLTKQAQSHAARLIHNEFARRPDPQLEHGAQSTLPLFACDLAGSAALSSQLRVGPALRPLATDPWGPAIHSPPPLWINDARRWNLMEPSAPSRDLASWC